MEYLIGRTPAQFEFHQAAREVVESVWPLFDRNPEYLHGKILHRILRDRYTEG